jgi:DNA polymerase II small subunit
MKDKEKLIEDFFERGVLVNKDLLDGKISDDMVKIVNAEQDLLVLNDDYLSVMGQQKSLVDWHEMDKHRVEAEKERDDGLYQAELQKIKTTPLVVTNPQVNQEQKISSLEVELQSSGEGTFSTTSMNTTTEATPLLSSEPNPYVNVVITYENTPHKYTLKDFSSIFISRYNFLERILRNRQELQNTMSIDRVLKKTEKEQVSIIGLVQEIGITKNGNIILKIEDITGIISVLFSKNKPDTFDLANELVLDEIVGIVGTCQGDIIFADKLVWPDIPEGKELKKSPVEEYVLFLSDIHVGSKLFQRAEFEKFLSWLNSNSGNEEQKELAKKVKYIIIPGDLVDGVGIYPSQEEELEITDIKEQYKEFCTLIKKIPQDKQIIIGPGNHDAVHLAEPQPAFSREFCEPLFEMPNVTLVSNPAMVNIGKQEDFEGFDVLMYHGYSFDYYVANVDSIRNNGGYNRADLIMKFLLKRRHLAPSFKSTPYFPAHKEDPLLIKKIPDFMVSGHIHYCSVANYKNITMVCGSCWQKKTTFQEKLGHEPETARVPVVNLKTREIKILKFN